MVWFCGGHGVCLTDRGDPKLDDTAALAWLVDPGTGLVLGNQITPIAMTFDGAPHSVDVPLEMIAHDFAAGSSLTLQLVATTAAYLQPRLGCGVNFSTISISLPVVTSATKLG
jgi:ABC-2 type transport system ATP-binding protein